MKNEIIVFSTSSLPSLVETVCQNLTSNTRTAYGRHVLAFLEFCQNANLPIDFAATENFKNELISNGRGVASINQALAAIRFFVRQSARLGFISHDQAERIAAINSIKIRGKKIGNWLSKSQLETLLQPSIISTTSLLDKRDRVILALLGGAGLRRSEARLLTVEQIQLRENRWLIIDLVGKGQVTRSIPIAAWIKQILDDWTQAAGITSGVILRQCSWADGASTRPTRNKLFVSDLPISAETIRNVVLRRSSSLLGVVIAPHDLRRSFARLARLNGCPLEQIQLSLGHASISTTQIYLGSELNLKESASDFLHLEI